jgi:hypothetical protein
MVPVVFGVAGYAMCPDDRKLASLGSRIGK